MRLRARAEIWSHGDDPLWVPALADRVC